MFSRIAHILSLVACFALVGGHGALVQSYAWAKMVGERSGSGGRPLVDVIVETISGAAPCELCLSIQDSQLQDDGSPNPPPSNAKPVVGFLPTWSFVPAVPPLLAVLASPDTVPAARRSAPPSPPPRLLPVV